MDMTQNIIIEGIPAQINYIAYSLLVSEAKINCIAYSPLVLEAASSADDSTITIWDLKNMKILKMVGMVILGD